MEDINKLYDIDAQLKYLEQEKHHRCLNMPYKMYNVRCKLFYENNSKGYSKYYSSGMFPESGKVYVHNGHSGNHIQTDLYANSIQDLFEYVHWHNIQEFGKILLGFGEDEKSLSPSDFADTSDDYDPNDLDDQELLEEAFADIFADYKLLDDKLYSLIESLVPANIYMVQQILHGRKDQ